MKRSFVRSLPCAVLLAIAGAAAAQAPDPRTAGATIQGKSAGRPCTCTPTTSRLRSSRARPGSRMKRSKPTGSRDRSASRQDTLTTTPTPSSSRRPVVRSGSRSLRSRSSRKCSTTRRRCRPGCQRATGAPAGQGEPGLLRQDRLTSRHPGGDPQLRRDSISAATMAAPGREEAARNNGLRRAAGVDSVR